MLPNDLQCWFAGVARVGTLCLFKWLINNSTLAHFDAV